MANLSVKELRRVIEQSNARWQAEETPFVKMSADERLRHLGYTPGPNDGSLEQQESAAKANLQTFMGMPATTAMAYPNSFDLRNVSGSNFITTVKDQGGCGSCVAFGTVAAVEGTMRKQRSNPNLAVDYSEAHLFYCHARSEGRTCGGSNGGWWPENALNKFRHIGVADDPCYPYTAGDQNCSKLCSDWQKRITKITGWRRLTSPTEMKEWISTRGPLEACFTVYDDFFAYKGGIYRHVSGVVAGGHCVCCIGYNDTEKYWIMKNSWGTGFGESGYFRIAYGECGIDSWMDAIEGIKERLGLAMIVYGWVGSGYTTIFSSGDMGQGAGAIAWLTGDVNGDGKTEIVQLWNNNGKLAMIVYGWVGSGYTTIFSSGDMGQGAGAIAWLTGDVNGDGMVEIIQLWNNNGKLAMIVYG
jgi:C1A family cysteine protease